MNKASNKRLQRECRKAGNRPMLPRTIGLVCLALLVPMAVWSALEPPPVFLLKWGTVGNGNGQFIQPEGIAVGSDGSVFVTDMSTNSVQKFTPSGAFLLRWGSLGSGDGQFDGPTDAACDGAGNVYVSDFQGRVQRFDENGNFLGKFPIVGAAYALAVDPAGEFVYVTSGGRIEKFTADGTLVLMWSYDVGLVPSSRGVAVGPSGHVYITAHGDMRVVKFTPTGTIVTSWGGPGSGEGQFNGPFGVATDASENVYVTDGYRVQKFTSSGEFLTTWGTQGTGDGQFVNPAHLDLNDKGQIYVVDSGNDRVEKFGDTPVPVLQQSWGGLKSKYRSP